MKNFQKSFQNGGIFPYNRHQPKMQHQLALWHLSPVIRSYLCTHMLKLYGAIHVGDVIRCSLLCEVLTLRKLTKKTSCLEKFGAETSSCWLYLVRSQLFMSSILLTKSLHRLPSIPPSHFCLWTLLWHHDHFLDDDCCLTVRSLKNADYPNPAYGVDYLKLDIRKSFDISTPPTVRWWRCIPWTILQECLD